MRPRIIYALSFVAALAFSSAVNAASVTDPGQGPVTIDAGSSGATELSGLTWLGGASYFAISDATSDVLHAFKLSCEVDSDSGQIIAVPTIGESLGLAGGQDLEGIAYETSTNTLAVSDEVGPAVYFFDRTTGQLLDSLSVPAVFAAGLRSNLGFESLTRAADGALWTANEEALTSDGGVASFSAGTIVRLQRFGPDHQPDGQWGYVTDPISADILGSTPGRDVERSGVVDLAILEDGALLALERMLGGNPANGLPIFRIRIYEISLHGADDTSVLPALTLGQFHPAEKTLLWEATFDAIGPQRNFEGMAVGPQLDNGAFSLLMIADDGGFGGASQALYALQVTADGRVFSDGFETGDASRWSGRGSIEP